MRNRLPIVLVLFMAPAIGFQPACAGEQPGPGYQMKNEPSGERYDITKTGKPERPWLQPYYRMVITKLCLVESTGTDVEIRYTFDEALEVIRKFDNITLGAPKIIYLVVFPFHTYPAWTEIPQGLKRPQDETAVESLRWLMREARERHNTLLSLHINMLDATPHSPLWDTYVKYDIIHKQKDGTISTGFAWHGLRTAPVSYYQEWKLGFAQERIDGLLEMLPDLTTHTKSIHIDAFQCWEQNNPYPSPYLGHDQERECETMRKIFRYFRDKGVDVTAEGFTQKRDEDFAGLQPFCWLKYRKGPDIHVNDLYPPHIYKSTAINLANTLRMNHWEENEMWQERAWRELAGRMGYVVVDYIRGCDLEAGNANTYDIPDRGERTEAKMPRQYKPVPEDLCLPILWRDDNSVLVECMGQHRPKGFAFTLPASYKDVTRAVLSGITTDGLKKVQEVPVAGLRFQTPIPIRRNTPYVLTPDK
jgi:hypothetical protein